MQALANVGKAAMPNKTADEYMAEERSRGRINLMNRLSETTGTPGEIEAALRAASLSAQERADIPRMVDMQENASPVSASVPSLGGVSPRGINLNPLEGAEGSLIKPLKTVKAPVDEGTREMEVGIKTLGFPRNRVVEEDIKKAGSKPSTHKEKGLTDFYKDALSTFKVEKGLSEMSGVAPTPENIKAIGRKMELGSGKTWTADERKKAADFIKTSLSIQSGAQAQ